MVHGESRWCIMVPTGWSPRDAGRATINQLLDLGRVERHQVEQIIATGYGRVAFEDADRTITEIKCHARAWLNCTRRYGPLSTSAVRTAR